MDDHALRSTMNQLLCGQYVTESRATRTPGTKRKSMGALQQLDTLHLRGDVRPRTRTGSRSKCCTGRRRSGYMSAFQSVFPRHAKLTTQEISNICYLAFPDSNSGCMGDTTFTIRLQNAPAAAELKREHCAYNHKCPVALQINPAYYWGYVYFRQVKDVTLPRGYFQKVVRVQGRIYVEQPVSF